ncbi:MAG: hypothetical protein CMH56_14745 [Myxococcales bacterium]|nr:hypothetical protein [Myxococcales bacterium]
MKITEKQALLALDLLRFPGRLKHLLQEPGGAETLLKSLYGPNLPLISGWKPKGRLWELGLSALLEQVVSIEKRLHAHAVWLFLPEESHPLSRIKTPPFVLYGWGNRQLMNTGGHRIAVVGTRSPTPTGAARTRKWVEVWAESNIHIVSGGATGIDSVAHATAIKTGGSTLSFLGQQLRSDLSMPSPKWAPWSDLNRICVLTEYSPWRPSRKGTFVARNRLVAGMSDVVVVMEGHTQSGAIHTLKYAKKNRIPGYAVLGPPENPLAGAGSRAVCEGLAQPALSPLQILEFTQQKSSKLHLALDSVGQLKIKPPRASQLTPITDQNQQHLFSLITGHATGLSFEELLYESGMGLPALQGALTEMELEGWVARQGALYYPKG